MISILRYHVYCCVYEQLPGAALKLTFQLFSSLMLVKFAHHHLYINASRFSTQQQHTYNMACIGVLSYDLTHGETWLYCRPAAEHTPAVVYRSCCTNRRVLVVWDTSNVDEQRSPFLPLFEASNLNLSTALYPVTG